MVKVARLVIAQRELDAIVQQAVTSPAREVGGLFVGAVRDGEAVVAFTVPAGPGARQTPVRFEPDTPWQQAVLDLLTDRFPGLQYAGEWHKHPSLYSRPSGRDLKTAREIVTNDSYNTPLGVFSIVVLNETRLVLRAFALARGELDFHEIPIDVVPDTDPRVRALLIPETTRKEVNPADAETPTADRQARTLRGSPVRRFVARLRACTPW